IGAFPRIAVQIELHGYALANAGSSARSVGAIPEPAARRSECGGARILNGEGYAIRCRVRQLEAEIVGEILHVHESFIERAASFVDAAIRQPEPGSVDGS